jgi:hypothetical protein
MPNIRELRFGDFSPNRYESLGTTTAERMGRFQSGLWMFTLEGLPDLSAAKSTLPLFNLYRQLV